MTRKGNPHTLKGKGFKEHPENCNRKGRPKLPDLSELMAKILGREKEGQTAAEAILINIFNQATKGNLKAAELLLDRGYGRAKQQTDVNANINLSGEVKLTAEERKKEIARLKLKLLLSFRRN